jgi:hypothetical protein
MHMIEFVHELVIQKYKDRPPGMFDPETSEIRLLCAVLRETPTWQEVIECALARNLITSYVVETTYIYTLASIKAAKEVIPEAVTGRDPRDIGLRTALLKILEFGASPQTSEETSLSILIFSKKVYMRWSWNWRRPMGMGGSPM